MTDRKPIDWRKLKWHKRDILDRIADDGLVDIKACLLDLDRRGALAELEYAGDVLRAGPIMPNHLQAYRAATCAEDRESFRNQRIMWNEDDMQTYNARKAMEKSNAATK